MSDLSCVQPAIEKIAAAMSKSETTFMAQQAFARLMEFQFWFNCHLEELTSHPTTNPTNPT